MDDASLDEFVGASDDSDADASDGTAESGQGVTGDEAETDGTGADPGEDPATDTDAVDTATSTYAWSGADAVCAVCDESVARRWRDGDDLVCADCKEW
ncbi:DUF7573 domain-containing protein [Halorientalis pallida]|uniref:DUF7573 domain-containing protein n=1 Tax=Halorientalis pallida TaxID=2479928 RepID=A0A498KS31_9EURY|nr:hypothetical protein [Halorientalis pallida]RXK47328.1 hypothetical protein EAF64_16225 [Halorientalis pallida]